MAAAAVVLPHDMMEDILSRLPIKSLQRLRCMSKSSNSLISTRHFARMQVNRTLQSSSQSILLSSPSPPNFKSLDFENGSNSLADEAAISRLVFPAKTPHNLPVLVVGSCHGLLCLAFDNGKDFYLWNPSTGDYNKLPDPHLIPDKPPTAGRIFHSYSFVYGFGYDSLADDYKLLLGLIIFWSTKVKIEKEVKFAIFSMRENCWRIIQQLPPTHLIDGGSPRFGYSLANGTLNWLVKNGFEIKDCALVAFDLKTEMFLELPMPNTDDVASRAYAGLGVLEGKLCLSVATDHQRFSSNFIIELWVMNEYGVEKSWTRLLDSPFETKYPYRFPLCISKDNQIILCDIRSNKLTRFDAAGERRTDMCDFCKYCENKNVYPSIQNPYSSKHYYPCKAVIYLESLVSTNFKNTACIDK